MHELAVENAGALGVRGQQPYHERNLEFKVEGEPVGRTEARSAHGRGYTACSAHGRGYTARSAHGKGYTGFNSRDPGQFPPFKWRRGGVAGVGNAKLRTMWKVRRGSI